MKQMVYLAENIYIFVSAGRFILAVPGVVWCSYIMITIISHPLHYTPSYHPDLHYYLHQIIEIMVISTKHHYTLHTRQIKGSAPVNANNKGKQLLII